MPIRYTVRSGEDGFGVWDAVVHGWRTEQNLTHAEAQRRAAELTARDDAADAHLSPGVNGGSRTAGVPAAAPEHRNPADTRTVDPPRKVEVFANGAWWPGELDRWARHPDGWYGRATRDAVPTADWYPSGQLRPVD